MSATQTADRYRLQSLQYLDNALRSLEAGEPAKASEFLWGSLAEALKAIAASRGKLIKTHGELWKYAREAAKEMGDESVYTVFSEASGLHSNFYEAERISEDVYPFVGRIRETVVKILSLLPEPEVTP